MGTVLELEEDEELLGAFSTAPLLNTNDCPPEITVAVCDVPFLRTNAMLPGVLSVCAVKLPVPIRLLLESFTSTVLPKVDIVMPLPDQTCTAEDDTADTAEGDTAEDDTEDDADEDDTDDDDDDPEKYVEMCLSGANVNPSGRRSLVFRT